MAAFARNTVFANIFIALVYAGGILAAMNMSRETFPDFHMNTIQILVKWPGADPEEIEEGICRKIEEAIDGIEGIKRYHTISNENFGLALIEVKENQDINLTKERIRNAVDAITTFPQDAEKPVIEEFLLRVPVLFIALASDTATEKDRKEWAEQIKDEILTIPDLSQVRVLGTRDYEISIEVSEERLRQYGLTFDQVAQVVRANSLNLPGGLVRTQGEEIRLRTIGRNYTAEDFAHIVVMAQPNGEHITLDRIADVRDAFSEDNVISHFNGQPAATISILKTPQEDSLKIDKAVCAYIERKRAELPPSVHIEAWGRMSTLLESRINLLLTNGLQGLILVFIMLWLFLDIRLSFWAGQGMPFSVLGALVVLWLWGETINMISLFGMVTVLGIIVDDAIVVGEAIYVARQNGAPPLKAAVDGLMEVGMPVIASVTTTLVAFVPLSFVGGFMGKIVHVLPIVVISALTISVLECMFCLPAHLSHLPDPNARTESRNVLIRMGIRFHHFTNKGLDRFVDRYYEPFVSAALRRRYLTICLSITVLLACVGFVESGLLKFELFPRLDGNSMSATIELPNGAPVEATEAAVARIETALREIEASRKTKSGAPLIRNVFALAGAKIDERGGKEVGTHYGSVRVELLDSADRGIHTEDLMAAWERQIGAIPGAVALTFRGDEITPPGRPIEIWLQANDMDSLLAASADLRAKLSTYDGVYQVQDDFRLGKNEIKLRLKPEARALGINVADLARQIYSGYYGQEALRVQRGRDDVRVRVRYPGDERRDLAELERIRIRTSGFRPAATSAAMLGMAGGPSAALGGQSALLAAQAAAMGPVYEVPLLSVADIDFGPGFSNINRTNGQRRVKVTAEVNSERVNSNEIVAHLGEDFLPALRSRYPNVNMSFQGEQQDLRESVDSLFYGFPLAILGICIIIAATFRSYVQTIVILFTVPFGICGAIIGHVLLGYQLSMMSIFGLVALAGVVVNDAIVLIDCVNVYLAKGENFFDALRLAGLRRFRPIFLTSITTVGGLMPLILEQDYQAQMLIPMAISLASGVAFATLLTLIVVPSLLYSANDIRRVMSWLYNGKWPSAEEVEPAHYRLQEEAQTHAGAPTQPEQSGAG